MQPQLFMSKNKNITGLTDSEVLKSRQEHGENILTPAEKEPLWKLFLEKFSDPLIIILLVGGVLSVAISIYEYVSLGGFFGADRYFRRHTACHRSWFLF